MIFRARPLPTIRSSLALPSAVGHRRPAFVLGLGLAWLALCFLALVILIPVASVAGLVIRGVIVLLPLALLWLLYAGAGGSRWAVAGLLVAILVVSNISIRQRDLSDTSLDPQNLVKLAIWGVGLLVALLNWSRLKEALREPPVLFFALFACWSIFTAVYSPIRTYSLGAGIALLSVVLFGAVARMTVPDGVLLRATIGSLSVLLWVGLLLYVVAPDRAMALMEGGNILRLAAPFGTPNALGSAAALVLLLCVVARLGNLIPMRSPFLLSGLVSSLGCLFLSQSRTAIAAVALSLLIIFLIRRPMRVLIGGIVFSLLLLLLVFLDVGLPEVAALFSRTGYVSEITTLTGRTRIWEFYIGEIAKEPLLGYGYASSKHLMPLLFRTYWGWTTTHAHNMWIQVAFTTGLIGLALFTAVFLAQLRTWLRTRDDLSLGMLVFVFVIGLAETGHVAAAAPSLVTVVWAVWLIGIPNRGSERARVDQSTDASAAASGESSSKQSRINPTLVAGAALRRPA
jgi:O-antigen ligase